LGVRSNRAAHGRRREMIEKVERMVEFARRLGECVAAQGDERGAEQIASHRDEYSPTC